MCKRCLDPACFAKVAKKQAEERKGKPTPRRRVGGAAPGPEQVAKSAADASAEGNGPAGPAAGSVGRSGSGARSASGAAALAAGSGSLRQASLRGAAVNGSGKAFLDLADVPVQVFAKPVGLIGVGEVGGGQEEEEGEEVQGDRTLKVDGSSGDEAGEAGDAGDVEEAGGEDGTALPGATRTSADVGGPRGQGEGGVTRRAKAAGKGKGQQAKGRGDDGAAAAALPVLRDAVHQAAEAGREAAGEAVRDMAGAAVAAMMPAEAQGLLSKIKSIFGMFRK